MKNRSNPPPSSDKPAGAKPMSAKRQKIMEIAMAQLKKTRAQMDPSVLKKIRSIIAENPKVMKGLGIDKMPEEKEAKAVEPHPKAVSQKAMNIETLLNKVKSDKERKAAQAPEKQVIEPRKGEEKIDQSKNMDVLAKLMQLKPSEIENIKSVIFKNKT